LRALVTGGAGFIGRYIVEQLLARGDEVVSFSRSAHPELVEIGAQTYQGDIQDRETLIAACAGVDVVFHLMGMWGEWGDWEPYYNINVAGTENVIAACRAQGVPKLVFTSTPSVVRDSRPQEGADESLPYPDRYESHYARSKALAEQAVLAANGSGLLTVSLRPHLVIGPGEEKIIPGLLNRAGDGQVPQIGDGTNLIDITYVEDAARAHLLAADALAPGSPAAGSAYFISQDEPVNAWKWINELFVALGFPPSRRKVPLWLALAACTGIETAYRVLPLKGDPPLTRFLAYALGLSHYYDISRAKADLGYKPQIDMAEVNRRIVAHFRKEMGR